VNVGLKKRNEVAGDVEVLKVAWREEEKNLKIAEEQANKIFVKLQAGTVKGEAKAVEVMKKKDSCLANKTEIEIEQAEANKDLQAALPFLHEVKSVGGTLLLYDVKTLKRENFF
jgi:dynein heavy chain